MTRKRKVIRFAQYAVPYVISIATAALISAQDYRNESHVYLILLIFTIAVILHAISYLIFRYIERKPGKKDESS